MRDEDRIFTKGSGFRDAPQAPRWFAWDGNTQDVPTTSRNHMPRLSRAPKKSSSTESPFSTHAPKQAELSQPVSMPSRPTASTTPQKKSNNTGCLTAIIIIVMIMVALNVFGVIASVIQERPDNFGVESTQDEMQNTLDSLDGNIMFENAEECVFDPDTSRVYIPDGYFDEQEEFHFYFEDDSHFSSYKKAKKYVLENWGEDYVTVFADENT